MLVLVIGNTGTGKSKFMSSLSDEEDCQFIFNDDYGDGSTRDFSHELWHALANSPTTYLEGVYVSKKERKALLDSIRSVYPIIRFKCYDFGPGNENSLQYRLNSTKKSKRDWDVVHREHKENYQRPSLEEGFSEIVYCYDESDV